MSIHDTNTRNSSTSENAGAQRLSASVPVTSVPVSSAFFRYYDQVEFSWGQCQDVATLEEWLQCPRHHKPVGRSGPAAAPLRVAWT